MKVGDVALCTRSCEPWLTKGKKYTITEVTDVQIFFKCNGGSLVNVMTDAFNDLLKVMKKENMSEVEWLDQIKENFKYD